MGLFERLKVLIHHLRHPQQKPPVTEALDARLDEAERHLSRLIARDEALAAAYRRGDAALRRK